MEAGADKDLTNEDGRTALMSEGVSPPGPSIAKLLLEAGANPNLQDKAGNTALFLASQNGFETNVRLLLEMGADRDLQNKEGQTALFCASHRNRPEIVALLLDARADADVKTSAGHTALLCVWVGLWDILCFSLIELQRVSSRNMGFRAVWGLGFRVKYFSEALRGQPRCSSQGQPEAGGIAVGCEG